MWAVRFERDAQKAIAAMHPQMRERVLDAIDELLVDPSKARNVKALKGSEKLRLRVGPFRVVYRLERDRLVVVVVNAGPRGGIYD